MPVVLAGDFNVVPTDRDIYPKNSYGKDALLTAAARARFARLLDQGWCDAVRSAHPDAPMYTYWSYLRNRWPRDAGLRIDHLLLSGEAAKLLVAAGVDRAVRGKDNASDHAPAWVELRAGGVAATFAYVIASSAAAKQRRKACCREVESARRPFLVIDGDSFAHRAYHALPKNIRRNGDRPAGAILGFANLLLRLYREEKPRAVLVGWDTYEEPTYRHEAFAAYQSGREFDDDIMEQLAIIPEFVAACGFANAKKRRLRGRRFSRRRGGRRGAARRHRADRQRRSRYLSAGVGQDDDSLSDPRRRRGAHRPGGSPRSATASSPRKCRISSRCAATRRTNCPALLASARPARQRCCANTAASTPSSKPAASPNRPTNLRLYRSIATMNRKAPVPQLADQKPTWQKAAALARKWELKQLAMRLGELT